MSKIGQLKEKIAKRDAYAMLITSSITQRYLTGFELCDGYILITADKAYMFADFRYIEAARSYESDELAIIQLEGGIAASVGKKISEYGVKTLGYEDNRVTCREREEIAKALPEITLEGVGAELEEMAQYKSKDEFEHIKRAQSYADAALANLLKNMTPDMTERDVALELEYHMKKAGAEGCSFQTIAVSGSASSLPHGVPRNVKLERGFLTMDFGALADGYCSDMTRTIVLGRATPEMKKVYDTVLRAQLAAIDYIREGVDCGEVDKIARDIIYGAGYEGCFGHGLGHGVGMYIHESPRLSPAGKGKRLSRGHVVTVEPGIYLEGRYGVRIEDMILMTDDGPVDITASPKEMIEIF